MQVQLEKHQWQLGERVGGVFSVVYAASSDVRPSAVVKLVPKEPGAEGELLFVDLTDVRNVVPIIDRGETNDHWVLVMPRAERSLRQYLGQIGGPLDVLDGVDILLDVTTALTDLDGKVVHGDLKPENILQLGGRWCLADFGLSGYAEATTALDTRKYAMTPAYAAPERWRGEHATIATDVYSLGIIAFELLTSSRPFDGTVHQLRERHLHTNSAHLTHVPAPLASLIDDCLNKAPDARPRPGNILARLQRIAESPAAVGLASDRRVFFSYTHDDRALAKRVSDALARSGIHVTNQAWDRASRQDWLARVRETIRASDLIVVLVTAAASASVGVDLALSRDLERGVELIPVLGMPVEIPPALRNLAVVDLTGDVDAGVRQLTEQIKAMLQADFSAMSSRAFENLVADLLQAVGFRLRDESMAADSNVDLVATYQRADPFGSPEAEVWLVEAKLYSHQRASVDVIRQLASHLAVSPGRTHGLLVTDAQLTSVALEYAAELERHPSGRLRVIDGPELRRLLRKFPEIVARHFDSDKTATSKGGPSDDS